MNRTDVSRCIDALRLLSEAEKEAWCDEKIPFKVLRQRLDGDRERLDELRRDIQSMLLETWRFSRATDEYRDALFAELNQRLDLLENADEQHRERIECEARPLYQIIRRVFALRPRGSRGGGRREVFRRAQAYFEPEATPGRLETDQLQPDAPALTG